MARKEARQIAMQLIYQYVMGGDGIASTIEETIEGPSLTTSDREYIDQVVLGAVERAQDLDARIAAHAQGWTLERIARVDLAILRLALFEMFYREDVPTGVAINEAVAEELSEMEDMEPQLVRVEKNADDTVSAIEVNSTEVNQLKNRLITAVSEKLMEIPNQDIHIPLGTLLGWQLLAGRGPDVQLQVVPASYVRAEINDSLTTAGINQTEHKLFIDFTVEMSAILPGYSTDVTVTDEVCIAQTMIIGPVPQVYASHTSP